MPNKIILGQTHCDTIGDFFKNPKLYRLLCEYFDLRENSHYSRDFRRDGKFTPKFYESIREIFSDYSNMKLFLSRVRTTIKENIRVIEKYSDDQLTQALLVFEHLHQALSNSGAGNITLAGVFQKSISDIILEAKNNSVYLDREEPEGGSLDSKSSLYTGLLEAVKFGCAITQDGKITFLQGQVKHGVYCVIELGSQEEIQVNIHGTIVTPFEKPVLKLVVDPTKKPAPSGKKGLGEQKPRAYLQLVVSN